MEEKIINHSKQHFSQAHGTPPTIPAMANLIGYGLNATSDAILHGTLANFPQLDALTNEFLRMYQINPNHPKINDVIPTIEIKQAYRKWKEKIASYQYTSS